MSDKQHLRSAYNLKRHEVRAYYEEWAEGYDAEVAANGYATPRRCAEALAANLPDRAAPVLDFACGTGLSGQALADAGFRTIDGVDLSAAMLKRARARGVYRALTEVEPDATVAAGTYAAIVACGAIGPGAAPASVIPGIVTALPPEGLFVLSLNDRALDVPDFTGPLEHEVAAERLRRISSERGAHLPGIDVQSTILVFARR